MASPEARIWALEQGLTLAAQTIVSLMDVVLSLIPVSVENEAKRTKLQEEIDRLKLQLTVVKR